MGNSSAKEQLSYIPDHEKILVCGYVRQCIDLIIPKEIVNVCILFYGQDSQSDILTGIEWSYLMHILHQQQLNANDNHKTKFIKLNPLYHKEKSVSALQAKETFMEFHKQCDDKGATVLIIKSEYNHVFGGYSSISWHSESGWESKQDNYAFLFLLRSQFKKHKSKLPKICKLQKKDHYCAVYHYSKEHGPAFGSNHSLIIDSATNTYMSGGGKEYDFIGNELCGGEKYSSESGSHKFKAEEFEVFEVNIIK
eukprot:237638_1